MAKRPIDVRYCEPFINTASIIVMVFLLSRTLTIRTVMSDIVLLALSKCTGRAAQALSVDKSQPIEI
jgi:hypothetical protein